MARSPSATLVTPQDFGQKVRAEQRTPPIPSGLLLGHPLGMNTPVREHWRRHGRRISSLLLGACILFTLMMRLPGLHSLSPVPFWGVGLVGWLGVSAGVEGLLARFIEPWMGAWSQRARWAWRWGSWAVAALLLVMIPVTPPGHPRTNSLELRVTAQHHPAAEGSEVWVFGRDGARRPIPLSQFTREGPWEKRGDALVSYVGKPAKLTWSGPQGLELVFPTNRWSGIVEVLWNGERQRLDLYPESRQPGQRTLLLSAATAPLSARGLLWRVCASISLGLLVLIGGLWATSRPARAPPVSSPGRWSWALYALPCLVSWSVWWFAYWPALMSGDSMDQWNQRVSGHYVDIHPVFATLFNTLITSVWYSPAAVAAFQMWALACTAGWCLTTLGRYGVPRLWTWGLCLLFALSPINGVMVITLWKDIPYSIALLLLSGFLIHIVFSEGAWLRERFSVALFGVVSGLAMLYRYNGFAACVGTSAMLLLAYPRLWRRVLGATVLGLVLWVGTLKIIEARLPVEHHPWAKLQPLVDQIAAHVAAGTSMTPEERAFVATLHPLDDGWNYSCYDHQRYYFDGRFHFEEIDAHPDTVVRVWWALLRRAPRVNLEHMLCSGTLVWRLSRGDSYLYTYAFWGGPGGELYTIPSNAHGLVPAPLWPSLTIPLADGLHWTEEDERVLFFWRPAFFLLVMLAGTAVVALRARSWRFLLLAAPGFFHSALLLLVTPNQDFRFQYGVYLTALLFGAPFLLGRLPCASPHRQERVSSTPSASA